ncbi:MAG TPA: hypothetical protein VG897_11375 [Terriglobales bacterium]|nr:hypothetical protein [Terriglobales bacterium]
MSKHHHDEGELHFEQIQHHGVGYEDRDLGARGIIVFLIVLCVAGFLICLMVWGYFDYHARQLRAVQPVTGPQMVVGVPPGANPAPEKRFPQPVLQTDEARDMFQYRQVEKTQLSTYGYVDQKQGVVHIPIDQAIEQVAKQGLPTRQQPNLPEAADFGSGHDTVAGAGGGVRPRNN